MTGSWIVWGCGFASFAGRQNNLTEEACGIFAHGIHERDNLRGQGSAAGWSRIRSRVGSRFDFSGGSGERSGRPSTVDMRLWVQSASLASHHSFGSLVDHGPRLYLHQSSSMTPLGSGEGLLRGWKAKAECSKLLRRRREQQEGQGSGNGR